MTISVPVGTDTKTVVLIRVINSDPYPQHCLLYVLPFHSLVI